MRFLVVNTDYGPFIEWLYSRNPGLAHVPFDEQQRARDATMFGVADFYARNLRALGHEVLNVYANIEPMQRQWAREHGVRLPASTQWRMGLKRKVVPWMMRESHQGWIEEALAAQVRRFKPDVIYSMCVETIGSEFLRSVAGDYRLAIGQHAAPLPLHDIKGYHLMLSSLPNQVEYFHRCGMQSELLRFAFEPRVLDHVGGLPKIFDVVFVGGVGGSHEQGTALIETLCKKFHVRVWGYGVQRVAPESPIREVWGGPAWGVEMYRALRSAKIVLNRHIDVSGRYANNMRLFETTGVGSLLLTDAKDNLAEMFEPGREVAAYRNPEHCCDLVEYFLTHDQEREEIARAGQARTIRDHRYDQRMQRLVEIVGRHLERVGRSGGRAQPVVAAAA
jgi:hypothetical protein